MPEVFSQLKPVECFAKQSCFRQGDNCNCLPADLQGVQFLIFATYSSRIPIA